MTTGQGHTGGLGKGGTQGLNGCGVKQRFRMDKIRPQVVVHLLLLPSDGYWATGMAYQKWNLGKLVIFSDAVGAVGLQGESSVWGTLCHGVDWQRSKSCPLCPSDSEQGWAHPKDAPVAG